MNKFQKELFFSKIKQIFDIGRTRFFFCVLRIVRGLTIKKVLKLKLPKKPCNKKCAPKLLFFKIALKVKFLYKVAKLGKASWDAYN